MGISLYLDTSYKCTMKKINQQHEELYKYPIVSNFVRFAAVQTDNLHNIFSSHTLSSYFTPHSLDNRSDYIVSLPTYIAVIHNPFVNFSVSSESQIRIVTDLLNAITTIVTRSPTSSFTPMNRRERERVVKVIVSQATDLFRAVLTAKQTPALLESFFSLLCLPYSSSALTSPPHPPTPQVDPFFTVHHIPPPRPLTTTTPKSASDIRNIFNPKHPFLFPAQIRSLAFVSATRFFVASIKEQFASALLTRSQDFLSSSSSTYHRIAPLVMLVVGLVLTGDSGRRVPPSTHPLALPRRRRALVGEIDQRTIGSACMLVFSALSCINALCNRRSARESDDEDEHGSDDNNEEDYLIRGKVHVEVDADNQNNQNSNEAEYSEEELSSIHRFTRDVRRYFSDLIEEQDCISAIHLHLCIPRIATGVLPSRKSSVHSEQTRSAHSAAEILHSPLGISSPFISTLPQLYDL